MTLPCSAGSSTRWADNTRPALAAVKPGGVVMHVGLQDWASEIDLRKLALAEITLLGTYAYITVDLRPTVRTLYAGAFSDLSWVEERPLAEGARVRRLRRRQPRRQGAAHPLLGTMPKGTLVSEANTRSRFPIPIVIELWNTTMATYRPTRSLDLTAQERVELESIVASRHLPHGLVRRARMILLTEAGVSVRETARRLKVTAPAVSNSRKRFREQRLAGLRDAPQSGRPRTHDEDRIAQLLDTALALRPKSATHWSVRTLAEHTGISRSTVHRYLSLFGVQPRGASSFKLSDDPLFIEKVREVAGLYVNPPDKALVLCVDEKSRVQACQKAKPVFALGLGYVEGITQNYVRCGTSTLFAALDIANGQVFAQCKPRHHHQEFLDFLHHIDANVPENLAVHLIVDIYDTHKHARVRAWLARRPRFQLHCTPTYSSWLNQAERWFGLVTQRAIRRGSLSSVTDLRRHIGRFVTDWNQHPKPFVWTANTESILTKLERLGKAICVT